jgi:hypothetical protein
MIKEMLKLRGEDLESWYASIDRDRKEYAALFAWNLREELYALKLEVEEGAGGSTAEPCQAAAPLLQRIGRRPDVSQTSGDQLRIRIRPPMGFWALNSFAVDYSVDQAPIVEKNTSIGAWADGDRDLLPALLKTDDAYYAMPNVGDRGWVNFPRASNAS